MPFAQREIGGEEGERERKLLQREEEAAAEAHCSFCKGRASGEYGNTPVLLSFLIILTGPNPPKSLVTQIRTIQNP